MAVETGSQKDNGDEDDQGEDSAPNTVSDDDASKDDNVVEEEENTTENVPSEALDETAVSEAEGIIPDDTDEKSTDEADLTIQSASTDDTT